MKKFLLIFLALIIVLLGASTLILRFPPWKLGDAVGVVTGLGAKLACSGRYISKFNNARIMDDLATYSPITRLVELDYQDDKTQVVATVFGINPTTAKYRKGMGCTLEFGDTTSLDNIKVPVVGMSKQAWPIGNNVATIDPIANQALQSLLVADNTEGLDTRALLVVKKGKIVAEAYAEGFDHETQLLGWSMAKSVTAILVASMEYQGLLSLNDKALFLEWQQDERKHIEVSHLLTMTSGLDFDETYQPGSDSTRMLFGAYSASDVALNSSVAYPPGEHFSYSSGTTNIISRLIFELSGGTAQANIDYIYKQILQPMGMHNTVFETDASGVFIGSSYVYANARDWARLGQLLINKGIANGKRLLNTEWVEKASTPNSSKNDPKYGFQFWLNAGEDTLRWPNLPADAYAMQGNRSQVVMIIPSLEMVIVRLGWTSGKYPINEKFANVIP